MTFISQNQMKDRERRYKQDINKYITIYALKRNNEYIKHLRV